MQRDDLSLMLDVLSTSSPFGEDGPNEMETVAVASYHPENKFKHVVVNMRDMNGNALVVIGNVKEALKKRGKASPQELAIFVAECMRGDYENVLATVVKWVTVTDEDPDRGDDAWSAMLRIAGQEREPEE